MKEEEIALKEYVSRNEDLKKIVKGIAQEPEETKKEYQQRKCEERSERYQEKPLHGCYSRYCKDKINQESIWLWLNKGDIKFETEGLIIAAQDQALPTNYLKSKYHTSKSPLCRLCNERVETIEHIVAGCKVLAGKEYMERHNKVAAAIHWSLCKKHQIMCDADNWWNHQPEKVIENENVKILWDFNIYTEKKIEARRPDIVVIDKKEKSVQLNDIAVPKGSRIDEKEAEKIDKYQELRIELERLWNMKTKIVPIVIGALGAISTQFKNHIDRLELNNINLIEIQKSVILGTASILRKVLQLSGAG